MSRRPPPFTVQDIVRATQGALVTGDLAVPVTGVSIDSRALTVGEAFFAIKGHRLDGHAYLAEAAGRGSACLIVHELPDEVPPNVPLVLVQDTTRALGRLAAWHRGKFAIPVVAVTGSNGKTTTKELIAAILATRWNTLKPAGSFNNQWGLPLTLLGLGREHGALVVELGTNQPGEIAELAALASPTVGAVTVVAPVHTVFLGSIGACGVYADIPPLAYILHLKPTDKPEVLIWTFGGMLGYHGINSAGIGQFANALGGGPRGQFGMPQPVPLPFGPGLSAPLACHH